MLDMIMFELRSQYKNMYAMQSFVQRVLARAWLLWGLSLTQWGLITRDRSFYEGAIGSFSRAAAVCPAFAEAYLRRGIIRSRELGQHEHAIGDLDTALHYAPRLAEAYLQRGLIQRFHGDPQAAIVDLRQFVALTPGSSWCAEAERQIAQIEQGL